MLDGIDAAIEAGLAPVKVNMVVRRGVNEDSVIPMASWARETGVILRFIEYMDVGHSNGWRLDEVVPAADLVDTIAAPGRRAGRAGLPWRGRRALAVPRRRGEFGVISSVTQPFCRDCTRARISAEGKLYTCLFAAEGHDLRAVLRSEASDEDLPRRIERSGSAAATAIPSCARRRLDPAQDRDVRDGRLRRLVAGPRTRPGACPQAVHRRRQLVDGAALGLAALRG